MKQPVSVTIDPTCPLAYVQYFPDDVEYEGSLPLRRDDDGVVRDYTHAEVHYVDTGVMIDVMPDDEIYAFEILDIRDAESVAIARDYAADNELAFPADLRAAAAEHAARNPAA